MLALSNFLASAASTHSLQQSIFHNCIKVLEDQSVVATEDRWLVMSGSAKPATEQQTSRKRGTDRWQKLTREDRYSQASSEIDRARLLATSSTHSGDWLYAAPTVSTGLRRSNENSCSTHIGMPGM